MLGVTPTDKKLVHKLQAQATWFSVINRYILEILQGTLPQILKIE